MHAGAGDVVCSQVEGAAQLAYSCLMAILCSLLPACLRMATCCEALSIHAYIALNEWVSGFSASHKVAHMLPMHMLLCGDTHTHTHAHTQVMQILG